MMVKSNRIKWCILFLGMVMSIVLFVINDWQSQPDPYDNKAVIYKEELKDLLYIMDLTPEEVETLLFPLVSEVLTYDDFYYILDFLGLLNDSTQLSMKQGNQPIDRSTCLKIYQSILETLGVQVSEVTFTYWGQVPNEQRIITDLGNYESNTEETFWKYGSVYHSLVVDNKHLIVISEHGSIFSASKPIKSQEKINDTALVQSKDTNISLPENVRVVLTNDHEKEALRQEFQIKGSAEFSVSTKTASQTFPANTVISNETIQDWGVEQGAFVVESSENQTLYVKEADTGEWSAPYRGNFVVYKKQDQYWIVNQLPLEEYLLGVVPGEMPERFELEALKAQAICARTYACNQIQKDVYETYGADVDDSVYSQVYNKHGENPKATLAVTQTKGIVMVESTTDTVPTLANVYYFSTSCGYTAGLEVWGEVSDDYLTSVCTLIETKDVAMTDFYPREGALGPTESFDWNTFLKSKEIVAYDSESDYFRWKAIITLPPNNNFQIEQREVSGAVTKISLEKDGKKRIVEGEYTVRKEMGQYLTSLSDYQGDGIAMDILPSAWFVVEPVPNTNEYILYGGGYGHGIGMSQYGADKMANMGITCDEILSFYFPGVSLQQ